MESVQNLTIYLLDNYNLSLAAAAAADETIQQASTLRPVATVGLRNDVCVGLYRNLWVFRLAF